MRILFSNSAASIPLLHQEASALTLSPMTATTPHSVVVIMGATGTGKSKLSIDLAARFPSQVVNSDKIQLYRGLDITTNKMPISDRHGVPHHLLGALDPSAGELTPAGFRSLAGRVVSGIASRRRLPVVAGGSNSLLHALMADRYDPRWDPFANIDGAMGLGRRYGFRYRCCFLWVDVESGLLSEHLDRRVDEMVGAGMAEELETYLAAAERRHPGLGKAIGVPEFRAYFSKKGRRTAEEYAGAVRAIMENTRRLAVEQVRKIKRLGELGWEMRRVDATETVRARMLEGKGKGKEAAEGEAWERDVLRPSLDAVQGFLEDADHCCHMTHHPLAVNS